MSTNDRVKRTTLWQHGRKGDPLLTRVLVDTKQDRVEVLYKDGTGERKKEIFSPDSRASRANAIAWAKTFVEEAQKAGGADAETTHAELWRAYTESPAWANLRKTSKPSYTHRWQRWVKFRGARTRPDDTTLHHVDRFIMEERRPVERKGKVRHPSINQIREALNVVRTVYRWGVQRQLITTNVFEGWRWQTPKDAVRHEPEEYTEAEYLALLAQLNPQSSRLWRAWVMLMLAGHTGQRGRALTHLRWEDVTETEIHWPAQYQKNGKVLVQPLTWDAVAALETARHWRERLGYEGPWVLPGGSKKKRGEAVELPKWAQDPKHKQVGTGTGKPREVKDAPYSYQAGYDQLIAAELRAKVPHQAGRAFHGFRKMVAGNVNDATGDAGLAMQFIGDDIRQAPRYLKRRGARLQRAADAIQTKGDTK